ncbi:hypothetical protein B0I37DRAFT_148276 [Chaetomium sp. MPI-CAGE-AT-0009]|nr:hypothetical protein B0I37DRAFT_148276 [Chaetomium sp. MPI-CAGE-AT-0009]
MEVKLPTGEHNTIVCWKISFISLFTLGGFLFYRGSDPRSSPIRPDTLHLRVVPACTYRTQPITKIRLDSTTPATISRQGRYGTTPQPGGVSRKKGKYRACSRQGPSVVCGREMTRFVHLASRHNLRTDQPPDNSSAWDTVRSAGQRLRVAGVSNLNSFRSRQNMCTSSRAMCSAKARISSSRRILWGGVVGWLTRLESNQKRQHPERG